MLGCNIEIMLLLSLFSVAVTFQKVIVEDLEYILTSTFGPNILLFFVISTIQVYRKGEFSVEIELLFQLVLKSSG